MIRRFSDDSDSFEFRRLCGDVNDTSSKPNPCILLIGGAETGTDGEDLATKWNRSDIWQWNW